MTVTHQALYQKIGWVRADWLAILQSNRGLFYDLYMSAVYRRLQHGPALHGQLFLTDCVLLICFSLSHTFLSNYGPNLCIPFT